MENELQKFENGEEILNVINNEFKNEFEDANFYELNEYIKEWLIEYESDIRKTLCGDNSDSEKDNIDDYLSPIEVAKKRIITEEYINNLVSCINKIDFIFLKDYNEIKKYNAFFMRFIQETCIGLSLDYNMFNKLIKTQINLFSESRKEERSFGAICYKLSEFDIVKEDYESKFKFIKLFLNSMIDTYGKAVFKRIIERYNEFTHTTSELGGK
ncbi:MAG: hypothetical protein ACOCRK_06030 [bacterium]